MKKKFVTKFLTLALVMALAFSMSGFTAFANGSEDAGMGSASEDLFTETDEEEKKSADEDEAADKKESKNKPADKKKSEDKAADEAGGKAKNAEKKEDSGMSATVVNDEKDAVKTGEPQSLPFAVTLGLAVVSSISGAVAAVVAYANYKKKEEQNAPRGMLR